MALIGRLFVILFAFLAACLVAGMIVIGAVLFPEFSDLGSGPVDPGALNIVLGFGFIFISGFALLPAMIVVAITEAFYIRGALTYAVGGPGFMMDAGPQCRRMARAAAPAEVAAAVAVAFAVAASFSTTCSAVILRSGLLAASRRMIAGLSHPSRLAKARTSG